MWFWQALVSALLVIAVAFALYFSDDDDWGGRA